MASADIVAGLYFASLGLGLCAWGIIEWRKARRLRLARAEAEGRCPVCGIDNAVCWMRCFRTDCPDGGKIWGRS